MLQMHNVNITNILAICITTYHLAGANYTHVLSHTAVDEAGSPSVVWHIFMDLSVSHVHLEKLSSYIVPNVASRACLYYTIANEL